jgi:hypothetical protein
VFSCFVVRRSFRFSREIFDGIKSDLTEQREENKERKEEEEKKATKSMVRHTSRLTRMATDFETQQHRRSIVEDDLDLYRHSTGEHDVSS